MEVKESKIIGELKLIREVLSNPRQIAYYDAIIRDARNIEITPLSEIFTEKEIKAIKTIINPQAKECYKNAHLLCNLYSDSDKSIEYVEGKMTVCGSFSTDHAWNKVGDKYIDITMELALERDPQEEEYVAMGEYSAQQINSIVLESGYYGNIYQEIYRKSIDNGQGKKN